MHIYLCIKCRAAIPISFYSESKSKSESAIWKVIGEPVHVETDRSAGSCEGFRIWFHYSVGYMEQLRKPPPFGSITLFNGVMQVWNFWKFFLAKKKLNRHLEKMAAENVVKKYQIFNCFYNPFPIKKKLFFFSLKNSFFYKLSIGYRENFGPNLHEGQKNYFLMMQPKILNFSRFFTGYFTVISIIVCEDFKYWFAVQILMF